MKKLPNHIWISNTGLDKCVVHVRITLGNIVIIPDKLVYRSTLFQKIVYIYHAFACCRNVFFFIFFKSFFAPKIIGVRVWKGFEVWIPLWQFYYSVLVFVPILFSHKLIFRFSFWLMVKETEHRTYASNKCRIS